ncbi:MAG: flagellar protein FliJ [Clostridia bacterium]|nr:flagellar protein FliJ [Clostridia bacterium]
MPAFRFSLEKVRSYRQAVEDKLKQELAAALRQRAREEALLAEIAREQSARQSQKHTGRLNISEAVQASLYLDYLAARRQLQEERVNALVEQVEKQKERVREAMRERKVMDRLRQRRLEAYRYLQGREEQKEVDEVAVSGYIRKQH